MALRIGEHPIHPMLVHFPIAAWTFGVAAEVAGWLSGQSECWRAAFACHALGVLLALPAMIAGFFEYASIPREHAAQGRAVAHFMAMGTAWLMFVAALALRGWPTGAPPPVLASVVAFAAWAAMAAGGWWGGMLVYRYGIGVLPPGAARGGR
jgi:uncharacterized membrane protein